MFPNPGAVHANCVSDISGGVQGGTPFIEGANLESEDGTPDDSGAVQGDRLFTASTYLENEGGVPDASGAVQGDSSFFSNTYLENGDGIGMCRNSDTGNVGLLAATCLESVPEELDVMRGEPYAGLRSLLAACQLCCLTLWHLNRRSCEGVELCIECLVQPRCRNMVAGCAPEHCVPVPRSA